MPEIAYGYCHCGCGEKTKLARQNHTREGTRKGKPRLFLRGHNHRLHSIEARLLARITKSPAGCWEFQGARSGPSGHRQLRINHRTQKAHRVAYEIWVGPIPAGLCVLHRCDNPPCVNPEHLRAGTIGDNNREKIERGRSGYTMANVLANAKLTSQTATEVRKLGDEGWFATDIARAYGICAATARRVINRESWTALEAE